MLLEEFGSLKKRYWGRHLWSKGYFCVTVGQLNEAMIKEYLEHHGEEVDDGVWVEAVDRT